MYANEPQIDYVLQSIIKADNIAKFSYKNGTRIKKGEYYKDANGIERFRHMIDFSHIGEEPWPLKFSRVYAKDLLKNSDSGSKAIQNTREVFFELILNNTMEKKEFLNFY